MGFRSLPTKVLDESMSGRIEPRSRGSKGSLYQKAKRIAKLRWVRMNIS